PPGCPQSSRVPSATPSASGCCRPRDCPRRPQLSPVVVSVARPRPGPHRAQRASGGPPRRSGRFQPHSTPSSCLLPALVAGRSPTVVEADHRHVRGERPDINLKAGTEVVGPLPCGRGALKIHGNAQWVRIVAAEEHLNLAGRINTNRLAG